MDRCPGCKRAVHVICGTAHADDEEGWGQRFWCSSVATECLLSSVTPAVGTAVHETISLPGSSSSAALTCPVPVISASVSATRKKRNVYPDVCKQAALQVDMAIGPKKTCETFGIPSESVLRKWRKIFPAPAVYQGPLDPEKPPRNIPELQLLAPHLRTQAENLLIFQHFVQSPPEKKRKATKESHLEKSNPEHATFGDFWAAEGESEAYLGEVEKIADSELEEAIALQLEKKIDENISAAGRSLIQSSMDFILKIRTKTKSKATRDAWDPRKKRFLVRHGLNVVLVNYMETICYLIAMGSFNSLRQMFWYKLNMLKARPSLAVPHPTISDNLQPANREDGNDVQDEDDEDELHSSVNDDDNIEAEINLDLDKFVDEPDIPEPDLSRKLVDGKIDPKSPFSTVLATAGNLLCWLRYDVLRNSPNRGYENLLQDIKAISDLWSDQCVAGLFADGAINPRKHPGVKAFEKAVSQRRIQVEESQYKDVGQYGLNQGYSKEQKRTMSVRYLDLTKKNHSYMGSRCDLLLSHAIMGRSEDLRNLDLKGLYIHEVRKGPKT